MVFGVTSCDLNAQTVLDEQQHGIYYSSNKQCPPSFPHKIPDCVAKWSTFGLGKVITMTKWSEYFETLITIYFDYDQASFAFWIWGVKLIPNISEILMISDCCWRFEADSKFNNYRTRRRTSQETEHNHNSSDDNRKSLNLLVVFNSLYIFITQLELGKLMFSFNHSLLPSKFNSYFSLNKQVHSYAKDQLA